MAWLTLRRETWYVGYREDGKLRRYSTGCLRQDRIGAEIKLREHNSAIANGAGRLPAKVAIQSLTEDIDSFWRYQRARQMTAKQADANRMRIRRLVKMTGVTKHSQISEAAVQQALAALRRSPKSPRQSSEEMPFASARTRNTYRKSIQTFLTWAMRNKLIASNPLSGMACENEQVDVRHARTAFTDEEFRLLYSAALNSDRVVEGVNGPTRALAYLVAAATGLRRGEMASVTPNSFDFNVHYPAVIIRAAYSKRRQQDTIPLSTQLVQHLKPVFRGLSPDALVFPGLEKKKTHVMIQRDLAAAGLAYCNAEGEFRDWHALRHSYITRAWRSGAAAHIVKELARHSDLRTTLSYSHHSREELKAAVDAVPQLPI